MNKTRRKAIADALESIESIIADEKTSLANLPEAIREGDQGSKSRIEIAHLTAIVEAMENFRLPTSENKKKAFVLINRERGFVGNCFLFWRDGGGGYTTNLDEAERFSEGEADGILKKPRPGEKRPKFVKLEARIAELWSAPTLNADDLPHSALES